MEKGLNWEKNRRKKRKRKRKRKEKRKEKRKKKRVVEERDERRGKKGTCPQERRMAIDDLPQPSEPNKHILNFCSMLK